MKKFLSLILLLNFINLSCSAFVADDFVNNSLDKSLQIQKHQTKNVEDVLVNNLNQDLEIKKIDLKKNILEDNLVKHYIKAKPAFRTRVVIEDNFLPAKPDNGKKIRKALNYSDPEKNIPVSIKILDNFTTKSRPEEGEYLQFETVADVKIGNIVYPKGTKVQGRIETVSMNTSMGVPSDLIIGHFQMKNLQLQGEVKKIGSNRSLWVYPCVYGGCVFFGAGLLLMPIRGGHAKITTLETFTLYAQ